MKILVPLDGSTFSEAVLPSAVQLAAGMDAEVHLVTVVEPPRTKSNWLEALSWADESTGELGLAGVAMPRTPADSGRDGEGATAERELQAAREYLGRVAERFPSGSVKTKAVSAETPVEALMAFCKEEGINLVAMSTHGRSGLGRWVYGSTADKLVQSTTVPLLLLRPKDNGDAAPTEVLISTLVVPLDGSELAELSLPYVEDMARKLKLSVSLVRVTPTPTLAFPGSETYAYDAQMYMDMEKASEVYLHEKRRELRDKGLEVECTLKTGHAATHIIDHAESIEGGLIVMTTHGRSGVGRWIMGSVADRVLRASAAPVLLLRSPSAPS